MCEVLIRSSWGRNESTMVALAFVVEMPTPRLCQTISIVLSLQSSLFLSNNVYARLDVGTDFYNLALKALFSSFSGSPSLGPTLSSVLFAGLPGVAFFFGAA